MSVEILHLTRGRATLLKVETQQVYITWLWARDKMLLLATDLVALAC
jgi:hypothetical protein